MPSYYLNRCWHIVNWTLRNKFQWNDDTSSYFFIQENVFEDAVCKLAAILSWLQFVKYEMPLVSMMTLLNGSIFRVTRPLCREFTGHRWIPRTMASNAGLWCFLWSAPWINAWVNNREAGDLRRHRNELKKCLIYVLWYLRYLISYLVCYDEIHCTKPFWDIYVFRHWGQDKMKALSETTVSNARYRMKMFEFQLIFCWSLFLRVQLTILLHWSDNGLAPARWQAIIWTNGG